MFRFIVLVCSLLVVLHGCDWGEKETQTRRCEKENNCNYGCHKGYCWSQCNGSCALTDFKLPETFEPISDKDQCMTCMFKEWCWLKSNDGGYAKCSKVAECYNYRFNGCTGSCTV